MCLWAKFHGPILKYFSENGQNLQNSTYMTFWAILMCTFKPNIGKIGWKLREPIRFEKKKLTDRQADGRTTDGSASDKLRWLCQLKISLELPWSLFDTKPHDQKTHIVWMMRVERSLADGPFWGRFKQEVVCEFHFTEEGFRLVFNYLQNMFSQIIKLGNAFPQYILINNLTVTLSDE